MIDLMRFSVAWINLPFTLALLVVAFYWLSMILGLVHHDAHADMDADGDLDAHADAHVDGHVDGHADAHGDMDHADDVDAGAFGSVLKFLHVGEVPFTAVLSVLAVCLWALTILGNWYLNPGVALGPALLMLPPNLLIAGIATRILLIPAAPFLKHMNTGVARRTVLVGQVATVKTDEATDRSGQAEVIVNGVSVLLNVRTTDGARIPKGEQALIVSHDEARHIYEISKM